MAKVWTVLVGCIGVLIGYLIGTSPSGVTPPLIPANSVLNDLAPPPWPVFRLGVAVNEFLVTAAKAATPPRLKVFDIASSFYKSEVLYMLTYVGIIDLLGEKPRSCSQVASDLQLYERAVCSFTVAGHHYQLLEQVVTGGENIYSLSEAGKLLQTNTKHSLRNMALMMNGVMKDAVRAAGLKSIRTGKDGFSEAYGESYWSWANKNPEEQKQFDYAMKENTVQSAAAFLSDWAPSAGNITFCDIAGGVGTMLSAVLEHYPEMSGIVFDQPSVVKRSQEYLQTRGVSERARAVAGSFFEAFPAELGSCDIFLLRNIIHDWGDESCVAILKNIKAVAKPGSKVIVVDVVRGIHGSVMEEAKAMLDVVMLAANEFGAKERTISEFSSLFDTAGYVNTLAHIPLRDIASVIEMKV